VRFAAAALRSASSYARLRARHRDAFPLADAAGILGVDTRKVLDLIVGGNSSPSAYQTICTSGATRFTR